MTAGSTRIEREDLEAKLTEAAQALNSASAPARRTAWTVGVLTAAAGVVMAYFLGKRRGRLTRAFVELRRY